jgi:integrase
MRPEATPLGDYLTDWLATREGLRPSTRGSYENVIEAWIRPHIGRIPLRDLSSDDLTRLYATLRENGARRGKPLGSRSVQLVHTVLRMALDDAVQAGRLPVSPVERIPKRQRPKHRSEKQADRYWSPEEARRFLDARRDDRLYALWALALDTGTRRGELAALRWDHLDLDAAVMAVEASRGVVAGGDIVEGPTKSGKARKVDLDARTVTALRRWKVAQGRERMAAGEAWAGGTPGTSGYVFTDELGEAYRPNRLAKFFAEAQDGLGLPPLVFHGLRHTSATIALGQGVPLPLVSERLGHSQVSITLDVYSHAIPSQGADAARVIGGAIDGTAEVGS